MMRTAMKQLFLLVVLQLCVGNCLCFVAFKKYKIYWCRFNPID